jgi:hypothetical protein
LADFVKQEEKRGRLKTDTFMLPELDTPSSNTIRDGAFPGEPT